MQEGIGTQQEISMQVNSKTSTIQPRMPSGAQSGRGTSRRGHLRASSMPVRLLAIGCLAGGLTLAQAQTSGQGGGNGLYVGGNVGSSQRTGDSPLSGSIGKSDTGYKVYGGWEFHPNFAVEAGYADLGKFSGSVGSMKSRGAFADLVGKVPLADRLSALGRVGVYDGHTTVRDVAGANGKDNETNLKYGAGLQYDLSQSASLRAEWERYRLGVIDDHSNVNTYTLGANFRF
jgi:OOP family OmpA-OmpF porin